MKDKQTEQEVINAVRDRFEDSVRRLGTDTLAELAAIREQAMASRPSSFLKRLLVPAGALVLLGMVLIAYRDFLPHYLTRTQSAEEIDLLSIQEGLDAYDDIEFYEWLEDQGFTS